MVQQSQASPPSEVPEHVPVSAAVGELQEGYREARGCGSRDGAICTAG